MHNKINSPIIKYTRKNEQYYVFKGLSLKTVLEYANGIFENIGFLRDEIISEDCVPFMPWFAFEGSSRGFVAPCAAKDARTVISRMKAGISLENGIALAALETAGGLILYFVSQKTAVQFISRLAGFALDKDRFFQINRPICIYGATSAYAITGIMKKHGRGKIRLYDAVNRDGFIGDIELDKAFSAKIRDMGGGMFCATCADIMQQLNKLENCEILEISDYDMSPQPLEDDGLDKTVIILKEGGQLDKTSMSELLLLHNCGYCDKNRLNADIIALVRISGGINAVYCVNDGSSPAKPANSIPINEDLTVIRAAGDDDIRDTEYAEYEISKVLASLSKQGRTIYLTSPDGLIFPRNARGLREVPSDMIAHLAEYLDETGPFSFIILKEGCTPDMLDDNELREILYAGATTAPDMLLPEKLQMLYRVHDLYYSWVIAI